MCAKTLFSKCRVCIFIAVALLFVVTNSEATPKWRCNYKGQLHNSPAECAHPEYGGEWVDDDPAPSEDDPKAQEEATAAKVIEAAESISGTYKKNAKLSDRDNDVYNCTTFVQTVLENAGFTIDADAEQRIQMNDVDADELDSLVESGNTRIQGVVEALVNSRQGRFIAPVHAQRGDLIQYWYWDKDPDGNPVRAGHTAVVVENYGDGRFKLLGAHKSLHGVGEKIVKIPLANAYAVRGKLQ
jgi:hypothetical protein